MASEYYKRKYQDVKPEEHRELTKEEKWQNWWDYHKWHVVIGALALLCLASLLRDMMGIGRVHPDYQIAYVGADVLPDDTVAALEAALSELGEDLNGDGQTVVSLHQYATYANLLKELQTAEGKTDEILLQAQAAQLSLLADIEDSDSFLFLLDDPERFQQSYEILSYPDGTLPEEGDVSAKGCFLAWAECPVLSSLKLNTNKDSSTDGEVSDKNQEIMSNFYIARRGFWSDKTCENLEGCEILWAKLHEGAIS